MVEDSSNGPVDRDTPLRLADAVKIAFPMGGMTVSGLRREAARGRLVTMRIAGKDWVTLSAIREMLDKCRVVHEAPTCDHDHRSGARSLRTIDVKSAQDALHLTLQKLKQESRGRR